MDTNTGAGDGAATNTEVVSDDSGNEVLETQQDGSEASAAKPSAAAVKAMKERFKYTIDGEDVEEEVDLSDKESLRQRLQLAHAAKKRMLEAKSAKQKAFEVVRQFEEDPGNIFKRLGPKGREAAEKFLLEQINEEMLSPEEKSLRAEREELAQLRAEKARTKEESEKSEMSQQEAKIAEDYQARIIGALEKSNLPKTPELVKRMAKLMQGALDNGLELSADELAAEAKNDKMAELKAIIADADGDQLIALFGEDVANKIRMSDLRKLKEKQQVLFQQGSAKEDAGGSASPSGVRKAMTMDEWRESINRRLK